jgi:cation transport ATPase
MRKELNLKVGMITGDNKHTAVRVAQYLNIDLENVTYRAYPNDKKNKVARFQ